MKPTSRLKIGDIIIALEDIIISGTGLSYYIYKGHKYKIKEYLPLWKENAWYIIPNFVWNNNTVWKKNNCGKRYDAHLTESELFEKFDCTTIQRKEKLEK